MGLRINTNVQSFNAQRNLSKTKRSQDANFEKLASGSRIVRAGDDAAGLAISEKIKSDIRSNRQATRNANDGVSLIQIAEGSLNEMSAILIRLKELSVQAASDTIGDKERGFTDQEFKNLVEEIDRIANTTSFGGTQLLNGEGGVVDIQVGIANADSDRLQYDAEQTVATAEALGVEGLSVETKEQAQENLDILNESISIANRNRANLGALQNRLISTINNLEIKTENLQAANSRIRDTDMAVQVSELTKNNILTQAGTSVLAQANARPRLALNLLS